MCYFGMRLRPRYGETERIRGVRCGNRIRLRPTDRRPRDGAAPARPAHCPLAQRVLKVLPAPQGAAVTTDASAAARMTQVPRSDPATVEPLADPYASDSEEADGADTPVDMRRLLRAADAL